MIKHIAISPELTEFETLRKKLHAIYDQHFETGIAQFGDFTYGLPKIYSWGEGSVLRAGKFCSISENVTILLGGEHNTDWCSTYPFNALLRSQADIKGHPKTKGDVVIGNDVWIGNGAKILSGVHISDGCVIGTNALVTKSMPPYSICGGNPAAIIKYRFDEKTIRRFLEIKWWDWNSRLLFQAIPLLQSKNINDLFEFYETFVQHNL